MRARARRRLVAMAAAATAMTGMASFTIANAKSQPALAELDGRLMVAHGYSANGGTPVMQVSLRTASGLVRLHTSASEHANVMELAGKRVQVHGKRGIRSAAFDASKIAPDNGRGGGASRNAARGAATVAAATTRPMRIAIVLMHLPGSTVEPYSKASAQASVFGATNSVASWYNEVSGGQVAVSGTVYGYYNGVASCDLSTQTNAAEAAARTDGYVASNYDHVVVYTPGQGCGYAGIAWVGWNGVYLNGTLNNGVMEHELGHNLGVWHAGQYYCGTAPLSGSCLSDYGDPTDTMGSAGAGHHYSAEHKYMMGWIPTSEIQTISSGTQTYALTALENPLVAGSTELIHVARGDGTYYAIDRRSPVGYDAGISGVWVRIVAHVNTDDTELLGPSALAAGSTFTDAANHITIKTLSDTGPTASVQVCIGTCGTSPTTTTVSTTTTSSTTSTSTTSTTTTTTRPPGTTTTTTSGPTTTTTTQPPGPGAVTARNIVTAQRASSGNGSLTVTVPAPGIAANHTVIVLTYASSVNGSNVSCSDSRGNAYTVDLNSVGLQRLIVCSANVTTALQPGDTITSTYPSFSGSTIMSANDLSGIRAVSRVDATSVSSGNNSSINSGATGSTSQDTELLFGVEIHHSSPLFTAGSGYTVVGQAIFGIGSGRQSLTPEYKLVNTTGSYTADGTLSSGQQWRAGIVAYYLN